MWKKWCEGIKALNVTNKIRNMLDEWQALKKEKGI